MKYISRDDFMKADKEVRNQVINWWLDNLEIGDLIYSKIGSTNWKMEILATETQDPDWILHLIKDRSRVEEVICPLLTTDKLIEFIKFLDLITKEEKTFTIVVGSHKVVTVDLLSGLWELTQKICMNN